MEIILKNLPETNEAVYLVMEPSLLAQNGQIIYNNNEINNENQNEIVIGENKYKYSKINTKIENGFFSNTITNQVNQKTDLSLLLAIDNNSKESENNLMNVFINELNNLLNKNFLDKQKITQVMYDYYKINLEANKIDNVINNKIINKDSETFKIDISSKENNDAINLSSSLLKIKFDYSDDLIDISSSINIYFIFNSFEKILPLFSINKKEKQILILFEKINNLLLLEKDFKEKIVKLPIINDDFFQNINIYKNEIMNYFEDFVKKVDLEKKENKSKKSYNTKNNLNDLIKEAKNLLGCINKEQFKIREKDLYQKYMEIYSNNNQNNNLDIEELKSLINQFNNLNEELLDFLEKEKSLKNNQSKEKDKEISELKQKISELEKELKSDKNKQQQNPNKESTINSQPKNKKSKQRSISSVKVNNNTNTNNNQINIRTLESENYKLKKNIEELNNTISILKSKNESLIKSNDKLLREKNTQRYNEPLKNSKTENKSIYNSPKKSINQNTENKEQNSTSDKKSKIMNKTKTNTDLLLNGNSLLLLKKIQEENKELSKQLKDFNSKNEQLELSLKGISNNEIKKSNKNNTSLLFNFTKNTMGELKNIEKKYGITKNK